MRVKIVSGQVSNTVTLGSSAYTRAITITGTGSVTPTTYSADAIVTRHGLDHASVFNSGMVQGGTGASGTYGGDGGIGIDLTCSGVVVNHDKIIGGMGGAGYKVSGLGGAGVICKATGLLSNAGTIDGGGGYSAGSIYGTGSSGGVGVQLGTGMRAQNSGLIHGGNGVADDVKTLHGGYAGAGGIGVVMTGDAHLANSGTIEGGAGGQYPYLGGIYPRYYFFGTGGAGAAGVSLRDGGVISNSGTILGGAGGAGYYQAASAGNGIDLREGGKVTNSGVIAGGTGGGTDYNQATSGGIGVDLAAGGMLTNSGTITGGAGGYTVFGYGGNGGAGVSLDGGTVVTSGLIEGGAVGQSGLQDSMAGDGVQIGSQGGTLVVEQGGSVLGGSTGNNAGAGVSIQDDGVIRNAGIVLGGSTSFYYANAGDGIDLRAGTLTNTGTITGGVGGPVALPEGTGAGGIGVDLSTGGRLTNSGTITGGVGGYNHNNGSGGEGGAGVFIDGATVITSGTIAGGAGGLGDRGNGAVGAAVQFGGSIAGTLVIDPGAVFDGAIVGNAGLADTLVLAGHAAGTLAGFGTTVTGLNDIVVDANAHWMLDGTVTGSGSLLLDDGARVTLDGTVSIASIAFGAGVETLSFAGKETIGSVFSGFGAGDVIDLEKIQATSFSYSQGTLSLFDTGGSLVDTLTFAGHYSQDDFALQPTRMGTDIVYAGALPETAPAAHGAFADAGNPGWAVREMTLSAHQMEGLWFR